MSKALDAFLADHPLTETVDILVPDLAGVARGKRVPVKALASALTEPTFFTTSIYSLDTTGANVDRSGLVWHEGDADRPLVLDTGTLRPVPWADARAQIIGGMTEPDGGPFFADPRTVLKSVADRFAAFGLTPIAALEFEFFLLDGADDGNGVALIPHSPRTGRRPRESDVYTLEKLDDQEAFFALVERYCDAQDLPYKGSLAEFAPGQYEVNLGHVADMLRAADEALMFKRAVKAAARATGQRATFMAKPLAAESGSGLHVHLSLVGRDGRNAFADGEAGEHLLRRCVWGMQETMAEATLVFAPNANSFRRLRPMSYAPTAPTWGYNNRTVALRIPAGPAHATRIEHRVAGADANPYVVLAAVLAGALHGLVNDGDPGPPVTGNAYESTMPSLPLAWERAIDAMERASVLPAYLDERFCKLYTTVRRAEHDRFQSRITPTEYEWYLATV